MAEADLGHPVLEKESFYEARLIHRKDIHTASDHSAGRFLQYYKQLRWHLPHVYSWQTARFGDHKIFDGALRTIIIVNAP